MSDRQPVSSAAADAKASLRDPRRDRARRVAELLGVTLLGAAQEPRVLPPTPPQK